MHSRERPLRIWEVECGLMDSILSLSYEPRELENCFRSAGLDLPQCACLAERYTIVLTAHAASHDENPLSLLLERQLNCMHAASLRDLEQLGPVVLAQPLLCGGVPEDLAGRLWALGTCREATSLLPRVRAALSLCSLSVLSARLRAETPSIYPS